MLSKLKLAFRLAVKPSKEEKKGYTKYFKFLFFLYGLVAMFQICN
ncbi:hypothetical protein ORN01_25315 [Bacillus cereus]|nr:MULTISPECIES: hypothetical protein [Bacillus cereus group]MDA1509604.1 hypothetical protein [Bacillus cereus group sp. TH36-2LC]MDZ4632279.1 hypothetical protein [Bacillus cereus]